MTTAIRPIRSEEDLGAGELHEVVVNLAAATGDDHCVIDTHTPYVSPVAPALLSQIRELCRAREDMMRAEQRLLLQAKAIQRRLDAATAGDQPRPVTPSGHVSPAAASILALQHAIEVPHKYKLAHERALAKLAKQLPAWPWVESVRGFGAQGFAQIIGEAGDLSGYSNPAKLWKRMGLAVIDGERQRRVAGADAIVHGYVARRRTIMYLIGESLMKGNQDGPYRTAYLARKAYEVERAPDMPLIHAHNRARRYMEKLLLKHLWQQWRAATAA